MSAALVAEALRIAVIHGLPVALRGRPGVGKTSLVLSTARDLGAACEVVVGSLREPTDIGGLPVLTENGTVKLAPPRWAEQANNAEQGCIVLFDELTTASPAVQAAMLRVLRERVVGEQTLSPTVRLVAAYNDADDCGGYELELPMRSRLIHLELKADPQHFADGVLSRWSSSGKGGRLQSNNPPEGSWTHWAALVSGYILARPSLLESAPAEGSWGGYPTPRTWEMLVQAMAACDAEDASEEARLLLTAGTIGQGAASEFESFVAVLDLPNVDDLLKSPANAKECFDPARPDRSLVILTEVVERVASLASAQAWESAWEIGHYATKAGIGDLCVWAFRRLPALKPADAKVPKAFRALESLLASA